MARLVIPGLPHHVTQRGNGRARTFLNDDDYALYRNLLAENCAAAGVEAWAWVLMPNHAHLILTPSDEDGLRQALAATRRRYAGQIHAREKRTGHFWQGRFGCVAMDEAHLAAAIVYVALNPVRAKLVEHAEKWRWSSTPAHLGSVAKDGLTTVAPVRERFPDLETALEVFSAGKAMSKGTTSSKGLTGSYFANPFGAPQFRELHEGIARRTFEAAFAAGVYVGQIRTRLAIPGQEAEGPAAVAKALLELLES